MEYFGKKIFLNETGLGNWLVFLICSACDFRYRFTIFFCLVCFIGEAAAENGLNRNFYLILNYSQTRVELGEYQGSNMRMKKIASLSLNGLDKECLRHSFDLGANSETLIYFHCWLGNERTFHKITLRGLNETLSSDMAGGKNTISIIWKSKFRGYAYNWREAEKAGMKLHKVITWISELSSERVDVFCHSMGNRVFEGMMREMNVSGSNRILFNEVVLAAADLETNVFENELRTLANVAKRVHVFRHGGDRLLKLSQVRLGCGRLGLHGPDHLDSMLNANKNLYLVDVSGEGKLVSVDLSNHIYFHTRKTVREHLSKIFNHQPFPQTTQERIIYIFN